MKRLTKAQSELIDAFLAEHRIASLDEATRPAVIIVAGQDAGDRLAHSLQLDGVHTRIAGASRRRERKCKPDDVFSRGLMQE